MSMIRMMSQGPVYKSTIYALATGWGKSAVSVVRLSGPSATEALTLVSKSGIKPRIKPRHAYFKTFYDNLESHDIRVID